MQVFTDFPYWFWLLCIAAGAVFAGGLYFRERKMKRVAGNVPAIVALALLRCIAVSVICFLLLNPYLRSSRTVTEKPIVVVAMDNSTSMATGLRDTAAFKSALQALEENLSTDFEVRRYVFDDDLRESQSITFDGKSTNISEAYSGLQSIYRNLPVAAIVICSDGIYNAGSNPLYVKNDLVAPVFTIAAGDTVSKKDVRITWVQHNNLVYLKDKFTVTSDVFAMYCNNTQITVAMRELVGDNYRNLGEKTLTVTGDRFTESLEWELSADAVGIRHYQVMVRSVNDELTAENNYTDFFVEVLDARQKILLLADAPHPDIAALRRSIENNKNYELQVSLADAFNGKAGDYTLIILHNLPSAKNPVAQVLADADRLQIPLWFIAGAVTNIAALNSAQHLVQIETNRSSMSEVTASVNSGFNLFKVEDAFVNVLPKLPPLSAIYGQYAVSPAAQILLFQKVGSVSTKYPLLLYSAPGSKRTAVLLGEHIWKWRMYDYLLNLNQEVIDELVNKTVQYLAVKEDKKQFRVTAAGQIIHENEEVILDGELYNETSELINTPDVSITITNADGKELDFIMDRKGNRYQLNAGFLPPGNYRFEGKTTYNNTVYTDNGAFVISPLRLEVLNTTANHNLLYQLAENTNGAMVYPDQIPELAGKIRSGENAKPVLREEIKTQSIINLKWLFFVIAGLIAIEWFMRKYLGAY